MSVLICLDGTPLRDLRRCTREGYEYSSLEAHFRKQLDKSSAFGHQDDQITNALYLGRGVFIGRVMIR